MKRKGIVKIRGFNGKQKAAYQALETDIMKKMVLGKTQYWKHTNTKSRRSHNKSKPPVSRIPQTNMCVNNKFGRRSTKEY